MLYDLQYRLNEEGIEVMAGCGSQHLISEIRDAVSQAFREITITVDHDPEFGICRIIAVNNREIEHD